MVGRNASATYHKDAKKERDGKEPENKDMKIKHKTIQSMNSKTNTYTFFLFQISVNQ